MTDTLDPRWLDFAILVALQWGICFALAGLRHARVKQIVMIGAIGLLLGIPFGFAFDLLIGRNAGIFGYDLPASGAFIVLNGLLSYGAAVATAAFLPPLILPRAAGGRDDRNLVLILWSIVLVAALASLAFAVGPLLGMFRAGTIILSLGEVVAALRGCRTAIVAI